MQNKTSKPVLLFYEAYSNSSRQPARVTCVGALWKLSLYNARTRPRPEQSEPESMPTSPFIHTGRIVRGYFSPNSPNHALFGELTNHIRQIHWTLTTGQSQTSIFRCIYCRNTLVYPAAPKRPSPVLNSTSVFTFSRQNVTALWLVCSRWTWPSSQWEWWISGGKRKWACFRY